MPLAVMMRSASASPIAATWSRHGSIAMMPWRAQASTASRRPHCWRTVARLIDRFSVAINGSRQAVHSEQLFHAGGSELRVVQHARLVGEAEQLGEVDQRARALLPAHQDEVILQPVEPCQEHDAGLVEARGAFED